MGFLLFMLFLATLCGASAADSSEEMAQSVSSFPQLNPPSWPSSVRVFGPADDPDEIATAVNVAFAQNGGYSPTWHGQFSKKRFAFLFRPGKYRVEVPVGYYTQILGLGVRPDEVIFDSHRGVFCEQGDQDSFSGALNNFWRSAENFRTRAGKDWFSWWGSGNKGMLWATSQASPLRRIIVDTNLLLSQDVRGLGVGWSSGGYLGNVWVRGEVRPGSQQQYFTRNAKIGRWTASNWNLVFVGTVGAPPMQCSANTKGPFWNKVVTGPAVNIATTPVVAEKPFISIDRYGKYSLHVPRLSRGRSGPDFSPGKRIGFEAVFVARDTDSADAINAKLKQGLHVVLSPGIYHLTSPLELDHKDQVLIGLGIATLVPTAGTAAIRVGNVDGVRVAGVLLDAGSEQTDALLEWGDGSFSGDLDNPGLLHDLFVRVGGINPAARARIMVRIASGNVIGDNLWLWRADHGFGDTGIAGANPSDVGLVVTGNDVTMYGLAVEHTLTDQVQWTGDRGRTYFFQCELPYDASEAYGRAGYVGYRVSKAASHTAYGLGVYIYFRDNNVTVNRGVAVPEELESSMHSLVTVFLNGKGRMLHVLNNQGGAVGRGIQRLTRVCSEEPDDDQGMFGLRSVSDWLKTLGLSEDLGYGVGKTGGGRGNAIASLTAEAVAYHYVTSSVASFGLVLFFLILRRRANSREVSISPANIQFAAVAQDVAD
eukprot:TRINITY_DN5475_c0_g1_i1.p1 TRINITY_DN5475_c0_g1~~TRINITY_DN5475_c0_g1_i1.p1  ORF type:complete len:708 (+),score=103.17 TRINITY_DN5475_c0_g1_i1:56-2179(+)